MNKSAFFDVDYTLYNGYTASNLIRFLGEKGHIALDIIQKELELQNEYALGVIDYREAAQRALQLNGEAVKGRTLSEVRAWVQEFITEHNHIYPWAPELMALLKQKGYDIYLISASLEFCVKAIADILGVKNYYGTVAVTQNDRYTGALELVLNFEEKHSLVHRLLDETKHEKHVGFGDSEGDVDMLSAMDKAVVYNPKSQNLVSLATERGWFIANEENILEFARKSL